MKQSVAAIKRYRTRKLASLVTKAYYLYRRGNHDEMYNVVCEEFVELGGVYVKFLQGVLLKSFIMKRWHNPDKLKIFENLDSEPIDVAAILRHELKPQQLQQIALVQPQPFAAGSFGQVYYGQHVSGKPIIIKVLRPMVRELLKYDLRLLAAFSKSFSKRLTKNMDVQLDQALREFRDATLRETDYVGEANFAAEFYQYYKSHPTFIVPKTYLELCTKNIIVQDYIDGISVAHIVKLHEQGVDPRKYVREQLGSDLDTQLETLGFESISAVFNLPRIQGDPHPGNIRLMRDNKVGIIDFGIYATSPKNKAAFFGVIEQWSLFYENNENIVNLFEQFMRFFVNDLYKALQRLSSYQQTPEKHANFTREVGKVAQESFSGNIGAEQVKEILKDGRALGILNQTINKNNRFGLVMKLESSEIVRAAQTYLTLVGGLGRQAVVLPRVFERVVESVNREHPEIRSQAEEGMSIGDALEVVSDWLERVAERDPALFQQLLKRIKMSDNKNVPVKEAANA